MKGGLAVAVLGALGGAAVADWANDVESASDPVRATAPLPVRRARRETAGECSISDLSVGSYGAASA